MHLEYHHPGTTQGSIQVETLFLCPGFAPGCTIQDSNQGANQADVAVGSHSAFHPWYNPIFPSNPAFHPRWSPRNPIQPRIPHRVERISPPACRLEPGIAPWCTQRGNGDPGFHPHFNPCRCRERGSPRVPPWVGRRGRGELWVTQVGTRDCTLVHTTRTR